MSKFIFHFVNFSFPFDQSKEIILQFAKKYELDAGRTHLLLSELESTQKKSRFILTDKDLRVVSLEKRTRRFKRYGQGPIFIAAMVIKYFDTDIACRNIMLVDKDFYRILKRVAWKQALLVT